MSKIGDFNLSVVCVSVLFFVLFFGGMFLTGPDMIHKQLKSFVYAKMCRFKFSCQQELLV